MERILASVADLAMWERLVSHRYSSETSSPGVLSLGCRLGILTRLLIAGGPVVRGDLADDGLVVSAEDQKQTSTKADSVCSHSVDSSCRVHEDDLVNCDFLSLLVEYYTAFWQCIGFWFFFAELLVIAAVFILRHCSSRLVSFALPNSLSLK